MCASCGKMNFTLVTGSGPQTYVINLILCFQYFFIFVFLAAETIILMDRSPVSVVLFESKAIHVASIFRCDGHMNITPPTCTW